MKTYRNILLDVDGTLLDFGASERQGIRQVLTFYGFQPKEEYRIYYNDEEGEWPDIKKLTKKPGQLLSGAR